MHLAAFKWTSYTKLLQEKKAYTKYFAFAVKLDKKYFEGTLS